MMQKERTMQEKGEAFAAAGNDIAQNLIARRKRQNQILFRPSDECFFSLRDCLAAVEDRRVVALWAFSLAEDGVAALRKRGVPSADAAKNALSAARLWAAGQIKMPAAKREILACHACAKAQTDCFAAALLHAVGQACAVVHSVKHALGFPVYELTAYVWEFMRSDADTLSNDSLSVIFRYVRARIKEYEQKLRLARSDAALSTAPWAPFLSSPSR